MEIFTGSILIVAVVRSQPVQDLLASHNRHLRTCDTNDVRQTLFDVSTLLVARRQNLTRLVVDSDQIHRLLSMTFQTPLVGAELVDRDHRLFLQTIITCFIQARSIVPTEST